MELYRKTNSNFVPRYERNLSLDHVKIIVLFRAVNFHARCFSVLEADGPDPPMQAKTNEKNVAFHPLLLFIFDLFNRLVILVGFTTAFRAIF